MRGDCGRDLDNLSEPLQSHRRKPGRVTSPLSQTKLGLFVSSKKAWGPTTRHSWEERAPGVGSGGGCRPDSGLRTFQLAAPTPTGPPGCPVWTMPPFIRVVGSYLTRKVSALCGYSGDWKKIFFSFLKTFCYENCQRSSRRENNRASSHILTTTDAAFIKILSHFFTLPSFGDKNIS